MARAGPRACGLEGVKEDAPCMHGTRGAAGLRTVSDYVVKDPRGATWTG